MVRSVVTTGSSSATACVGNSVALSSSRVRRALLGSPDSVEEGDTSLVGATTVVGASGRVDGAFGAGTEGATVTEAGTMSVGCVDSGSCRSSATVACSADTVFSLSYPKFISRGADASSVWYSTVRVVGAGVDVSDSAVAGASVVTLSACRLTMIPPWTGDVAARRSKPTASRLARVVGIVLLLLLLPVRQGPNRKGATPFCTFCCIIRISGECRWACRFCLLKDEERSSNGSA